MRDVYAPSSQDPEASKLATVLALIADWELEPWPPTPASWVALAASLKKGEYKGLEKLP